VFGHKASAINGNGSKIIITVGGAENQILYKYMVDKNGSISGPMELNLSAVKSIGKNAMYGAFSGCTGLTGSISFPVLTTIDNLGMYYAFHSCTGLTGSVSFPALTSVGALGMYYAFYNTGITTIHFKSSLSSNSELTKSDIFGTTSGKSILFDLP
jgi:hypothetical protein